MKKEVKQQFWAGKQDKLQTQEWKETVEKEFNKPQSLPDESASNLELKGSRRDFLKLMGFGMGAAVVAAGCETPVRRAIPYVVKPDEIVPGVASYYATTYVDGGDCVPVLVKTREGRPIKIEGNSLSPLTKGGTSARAQASVLSLYNTNRIKHAYKRTGDKAEKISWDQLDDEVRSNLSSASSIRILANTIVSPTAMKAIEAFQAKYQGAELVMYDPVSSAAQLTANEQSYGKRALPNYHFDKAETIVSFGADFLGTWLSPVAFTQQYAEGRRLRSVTNPKMSWHVQFESAMSLTGSNADNRVMVKPSEMGSAIVALYNAVASRTGGSSVSALPLNDKAKKAVDRVAERLVSQRGKSLVVTSSNTVGEQLLVNQINSMLGNMDNTIDFNEALLVRKGDDPALRKLVRDMNAGSVDALLVWGANPAYDLPDADAFQTGIEKVGTRIALTTQVNETAALCNYAAPTHHYLESWGDAEPVERHYHLIQPVIAPLYETRQAEQSLLVWAGSDALDAEAEQPYYEFLKSTWRETAFAAQSRFGSFDNFWNQALHDGYVHVTAPSEPTVFTGSTAATPAITQPTNNELEVAFVETVNIGAGQHANNPWLQEMADPITRCVWGNYLMLPVAYDAASNDYVSPKGLSTFMDKADMANLSIGGKEQSVIVTPTFGTMPGTAGFALGYGRSVSGPAGQEVGVNVYPWLTVDADGYTQYYATEANLSGKTGRDEEYPCVQYHHTIGVTGEVDGETINVDERETIDFLTTGYQGGLTDRTILYTGSADHLSDLADTIAHDRAHAKKLNDETLYPDYSKIFGQGHHWGMYIDMSACTGCGACTVACMAENNIPVVGRKEVHRHHEMTWLRIDRYFYGDVNNPHVAYQPVMCQHCDNAPCENVCPVNATNHSSEGLNQMAYNRCIGTRYCANNCPFKVRRFNWLDYTSADLFPANENHVYDADDQGVFYTDNIVRMVFNPDVTVRSRGVIEKCSFCVQRIQEGKLTAKVEGTLLRDGQVKTACQSACPTGAIVFGDQNDKDSLLSRQSRSPLAYRLIEETNMQTSVVYGARVNNSDKELEEIVNS